jgi:hypothetical protein
MVENINGKPTVGIPAGSNASIREEHLYKLLTVVSTRVDIELSQIGWAEELCVDGQRTDWAVIAITAQIAQRDPFRGWISGAVEQACHGRVAIIVTALGLPDTDIRELVIGRNTLVRVGAKEGLGFSCQVAAKQQPQSDRCTTA